MGLHIEISGDCSQNDWRAIAAIASIMLGGEPAKIVPPAVAEAPVAEPMAAVVPPPPPPAKTASEELFELEASRVITQPEATAVPMTLGAVELDGAGLPHDLRIHGAAKSKNKNGTWRLARGVEPALVTQVTTELFQIMSAVPPVADVTAAPVQTDPAAAFGAGTPPSVPNVLVVPPPPPAEAVVVPPPPALEDENAKPEYTAFMRKCIDLQAAKKVSTAQLTAIAVQLGLTGIRDLANRPDFIAAFEARLPQ